MCISAWVCAYRVGEDVAGAKVLVELEVQHVLPYRSRRQKQEGGGGGR